MASAEEVHVKLRYPIEILQNTLKCVICLEDYKDPVLTRCEHLYCWDCISRILDGRKHPCCPLCKKPVSRRSLTRLEYISQMITKFIELRDSIPKDTGFEIESYLGAPSGGREAPTNSPAVKKKIGRKNISERQTTSQDEVISVHSDRSAGGVTEDSVVVPKSVLTNEETSENLHSPKSKKFGRCYKGKPPEQRNFAHVFEELWGDADSVHSDSEDGGNELRPDKTDPQKSVLTSAPAGDVANNDMMSERSIANAVDEEVVIKEIIATSNSLGANIAKPLESKTAFPFSYPMRKSKEKATAFDKLLKESSIASSQALSEGRKNPQEKKIFMCRVEAERKGSSELSEEEKLDDPYAFVSSQHTPHRVKYTKDGIKDMGKVGQPRPRKITSKRMLIKEDVKLDLDSKVDEVSPLEMGSQNFIESCPVEVNDEFDKLVMEVRGSVQQACPSVRIGDAQSSKSDDEDANLAVLFRTPNTEDVVPEAPGENEESLAVVEVNEKKGGGRSSRRRKSLNISSWSSANAKSHLRRPKSIQPSILSGKHEKPTVSQEVRQIEKQFEEVSNYNLSVEEKEPMAIARGTDKNTVSLVNPEVVGGGQLQKRSNVSKRVSFADMENEVEPEEQKDAMCSDEQLSADISEGTDSAQCDDGGMVSNPKSSPVKSSLTVNHVDVASDIQKTPTGRNLLYPGRACPKSALAFDLVNEGVSSAPSPGEPVLGFVMSPASEQRSAQWKVCTARGSQLLAGSPPLKRKRAEGDEAHTTATEVTDVAIAATACGEPRDKTVVDGVIDSFGSEAQACCKDFTSPEIDSRMTTTAADTPKSISDLQCQQSAKKMKHSESYDTFKLVSLESSDSMVPNARHGIRDQGTQTFVEKAEVGTEVDLHLTSRPRSRTRTYAEASVQTDMFECTERMHPVLTVDVQTSPIKPLVRGTERSPSIELQFSGDSNSTHCLPGTFIRSTEDSADSVRDLSFLRAEVSSQNNHEVQEESEKLEFSFFDEAAVQNDVALGVGTSDLATKLPQTPGDKTKRHASPSKPMTSVVSTLSCEDKKSSQSNVDNKVLSSMTVKAAGQSPKAGDVCNSKTKVKGLLSLTSNKMSRKLSFSPNYVPTLSRSSFPLVVETDSESDGEPGPKRTYRSTKKLRCLSVSSDSDEEQPKNSVIDSRRNDVPDSVSVRPPLGSCSEPATSEAMDVEVSEEVDGKHLQPAAQQQPCQSSVVARVPAALSQEVETPSALITPSLQALLQAGVSEENTMENLEGGGISELATQHSAASVELMDSQQLQKIDLAIMAADAGTVRPNDPHHVRETEPKDAESPPVDDRDMMYDDIIEPTPQKESSFVTHRGSKAAGVNSTSKNLYFGDVSQSQVARLASENNPVGCVPAAGAEVPHGMSLGGQRPPLQVVTNAPPRDPRPPSASDSTPARKKPVCIACSMLYGQSKFLVQKLVEVFGLSYSVAYHPGVTHLLVPRTDESIQSVKYVFAVAEKKWVLYEDWARDSLKARVLLPEEKYEVREPVSDGPRRSRLSTEPLFKNHVLCFVPPLEAITRDQIEEVSMLCGAKVVPNPALLFPRQPGCRILLLANEKHVQAASDLLKTYKIPPVSYLYIIDCISAYKLFDPFTYLLTKEMPETIFRQFGYD